MVGQRHAGNGMNEQGTTLRRRGILAAAGAVVAGIVAKQAAEPVLAATLTLDADKGTGTRRRKYG